jgi:hypothetical protein
MRTMLLLLVSLLARPCWTRKTTKLLLLVDMLLLLLTTLRTTRNDSADAPSG